MSRGATFPAGGGRFVAARGPEWPGGAGGGQGGVRGDCGARVRGWRVLRFRPGARVCPGAVSAMGCRVPAGRSTSGALRSGGRNVCGRGRGPFLQAGEKVCGGPAGRALRVPMSARVAPGRTGPRVGTWAAGERCAGQARAGPRDSGQVSGCASGRPEAVGWKLQGFVGTPAPSGSGARVGATASPGPQALHPAARGGAVPPERTPARASSASPCAGPPRVIPSPEDSPLASWTVPGLVYGEDGGGDGLTLAAVGKGECRFLGGRSLPAETPGAALEGYERASERLLGGRSRLSLIGGVLGPRPLKERGVLGGMGTN